jgi:hypothetical protein
MISISRLEFFSLFLICFRSAFTLSATETMINRNKTYLLFFEQSILYFLRAHHLFLVIVTESEREKGGVVNI